MKIAIITIGDELLSGKTQDMNAHWLAGYLPQYGLTLSCAYTIGDDPEIMQETFLEFTKKYDVVITTGGLGPTKDDKTKAVLAKSFDKKLVKSEKCISIVKEQYERYGKVWEEVKEKMGERPPEQDYEFAPEDFSILTNPKGLAPGLYYKTDESFIISCPGVPSEFRLMFEESILPIIKAETNFPNEKKEQYVIRTREIPEEKIFYSLDKTLWDKLSGFGSVSSLPHKLGVDIIVSLYSKNKLSEVEEQLNNIIQNSPVAENVWQIGNLTLPEYIVQSAKEKNITFGFAESCTGGMLAHLITNVSGSSQVFYGSVVSYDNSVKQNSLNVSDDSLKNFGAVSEQVALEMASGSREHLNVDITVSTSGIAGPGGGSKEKPVGLVAIGFSSKNWSGSNLFQYRGDRIELKERFARKALYTLLDQINTF